MAGLLGNVPWKRFWIPRETGPALGLDGYLVDPEDGYGKVANAHARTLEQLEETPCVALLGEPGIGKSRVIDAYSAGLLAGADAETVLSIDFRLHRDLETEIFETGSFNQWLAGRSPLTLLLDSLDEHPEGAYEVARQLLVQLRRGPFHSLRLRVACRTAEWPGLFDEQLPQLWKSNEKEPRVAFYALAPLRRGDVEMAAGEDATSFLAEVTRMDAEPLAIKPITLDFLLAEYRENRKLPRSRVELYDEGCRILCEERSPSREGAGKPRLLQAEQRVAIASRIAAICILGRRSLVQRGPGRLPPNAVRIGELLGGVEPSVLGDVTVSAEAVAEVFEVSGLFAPRGAGYVGWAHQTYAEFLAARFLRERGLPAAEMLREVLNPEMGRSVPALRETIAWLASMDKKFFQCLLVIDPAPLLGSDFAVVGPDECEALVGALLGGISDRNVDARSVLYRPEIQARLRHPKLSAQLRPFLVERERPIMARISAIHLAEGCKIEALQNELIDLVLDVNEDDDIRSAAAHAVIINGTYFDPDSALSTAPI